MLNRFLLSLGLIFFIAGCATTQQPSAVNNLQIKVAQLEHTVEERDQEIRDLKYQVQEFSSQADNIDNSGKNSLALNDEESTTRRLRSESNMNKSSATTGDERIIRVAASSEDVQKALKKAGFYDGPIDGKVGTRTKKAISSFQKENNLKSDGIVGRNTWDVLKKNLD